MNAVHFGLFSFATLKRICNALLLLLTIWNFPCLPHKGPQGFLWHCHTESKQAVGRGQGNGESPDLEDQLLTAVYDDQRQHVLQQNDQT